jgi:hypothetical protein
MADNIPNFVVNTVSIANGATVSSAIDLQGRGLVQVIMPAAFTGSAITFQASPDNVTFQALYNTANTALSMTVTQGRTYMISPSDLVGVRYLKLVSGSAEGAARTITLVSRELA